MDAVSKRETPQLDLDALDMQGLKALVLAKQSELDSRNTEIESLKLLILKLKRMQFGPRSEKFSGDIEQLELQLEDLEVNQAAHRAAADSTSHGCVEHARLSASRRAAHFPLSFRVKPRQSRPSRTPVPIAVAHCACLARMCRKCSNMFRRASRSSARCGRS